MVRHVVGKESIRVCYAGTITAALSEVGYKRCGVELMKIKFINRQ